MARRSWAKANPEHLLSYIRAYADATRWCFDPTNRGRCLELLAEHNKLSDQPGQETLDALLDTGNGLYPAAELNIPGIVSALELRAEMGFLERPVPQPQKYIDTSYYTQAMTETSS